MTTTGMCNETAAKETKQTEVCNKGKLESGEKNATALKSKVARKCVHKYM